MVTVIIPNFNREKVVLRAIESVLKQTYKDFELLVVDDCSTDDSCHLISKIKDSRLKLIKLPENLGAAGARNFGIKYSSNKYISLLDSDDYFEPNFLEASLKAMENSSDDIGFSWTGVRYKENSKEKDFIWQPIRKKSPYLTFLTSLHIGTNSGITIKKEVFKEVGLFNSDLPAAEDTDFFLRVTKFYDYIIIPEILTNIERDSNDRLSKNFIKIALAYNQFLPDHFKEIDKDPTLQAKFYYKMMWLNYTLKNKSEARYFYDKIPVISLSSSLKTGFVKYLYEIFPLDIASGFHKKLTSY